MDCFPNEIIKHIFSFYEKWKYFANRNRFLNIEKLTKIPIPKFLQCRWMSTDNKKGEYGIYLRFPNNKENLFQILFHSLYLSFAIFKLSRNRIEYGYHSFTHEKYMKLSWFSHGDQ